MRRRLLLARALHARAAAGDPRRADRRASTSSCAIELWRYIRRLHEQGTTILLTTHYLEEAEELCQDVALIRGGRLLARDSPAGLKESFDADYPGGRLHEDRRGGPARAGRRGELASDSPGLGCPDERRPQGRSHRRPDQCRRLRAGAGEGAGGPSARGAGRALRDGGVRGRATTATASPGAGAPTASARLRRTSTRSSSSSTTPRRGWSRGSSPKRSRWSWAATARSGSARSLGTSNTPTRRPHLLRPPRRPQRPRRGPARARSTGWGWPTCSATRALSGAGRGRLEGAAARARAGPPVWLGPGAGAPRMRGRRSSGLDSRGSRWTKSRRPAGAAGRALAIAYPRFDRILVHFDVDVVDFTDTPLSENPGRNEGLPYERAAGAWRCSWRHRP